MRDLIAICWVDGRGRNTGHRLGSWHRQDAGASLRLRECRIARDSQVNLALSELPDRVRLDVKIVGLWR